MQSFPDALDADSLCEFLREALALVNNLERQVIVLDVHAHHGRAAIRMPMNIRQAFLHHAEKRNLHIVRQAP